jgi:uncharacterized protein (TIGR01370 family)
MIVPDGGSARGMESAGAFRRRDGDTMFHQRIEGTDLNINALFAVLLFLAILLPGLKAAWAKGSDWVVYYSERIPVEGFDKYEIIVLDSDHYPPLQPLKRQGKTLLGYLSLGEVEDYRPYFAALQSELTLLEENDIWKGSYLIDLRDGHWKAQLIEKLIPDILARGFDGIFLDTLDNATFLEEKDGRKYKGMTAAASDLVISIREHFPQITIMMNRAYELLPDVEQHIDIVLGESVYGTYSFEEKKYRPVSEDIYRRQIGLLQAARKRCPSLRVFTLDYWNPEDQEGLRNIYRIQRANGFEPYVSTIELDRIITEPK